MSLLPEHRCFAGRNICVERADDDWARLSGTAARTVNCYHVRPAQLMREGALARRLLVLPSSHTIDRACARTVKCGQLSGNEVGQETNGPLSSDRRAPA